MFAKRYSLGLDFGTESGRALLVDVSNGKEIASAVETYAHGHQGVILSKDHNLARQHPEDYLTSFLKTVRKVLGQAKRKVRGFKPEQIIGIGVDATGSTPMPVDQNGLSLAFQKRFAKNPAAMAWLWKDHTSFSEAEEITALAHKMRPEIMAKCGGTYSSEWFFSKILHCCRTTSKVFDAAYTWVEIADWIPAMLTGTQHPDTLMRGICAAGHKGMFHPDWGGYPDKKFLRKLDPKLAELRDRLPNEAYTIDKPVGGLTDEWAKKSGLPAGIPVAVGAIDAHFGAVGAGIGAGTLVKIIGTSTCDIMVASLAKGLPDIPGVCGIVPESVLPKHYGLEAGQSAVGDIFNWFVEYVLEAKDRGKLHGELTKKASKLKPGESGLLALDWNNGNRTVLVDQRLTGMLVGQTLYTKPEEIYRALIEATAFGALKIIDRLEEYGVKVRQIVNCGGIAEKNPMAMQIYADVTGRPMKLAGSGQTCALGAAIAGAVVAGRKAGGYPSYSAAQKAMTHVQSKDYKPDRKAHKTYRELYNLYSTLHDAFGTRQWEGNLGDVMKNLLEIQDRAK